MNGMIPLKVTIEQATETMLRGGFSVGGLGAASHLHLETLFLGWGGMPH